MKTIVLIFLFNLYFFCTLVWGQSTITDTVSLGAGYANHVWYSLANDNQGSSSKSNWDIAFETSGSMSSSIMFNTITGGSLWCYPKSDTTGWNSIDTTGLSTWSKRYNSDTSWSGGAFSRYTNGSPLDLGWGQYNMVTHQVVGDSIYIVRLASGQYRKLWIKSLASGIYTFQYANLDGTGLQTVTINKATYSNKNYVYYSLQTNTVVDREPPRTDWDLIFAQYTAFIPTPYTVAGVLHNKGVRVADCRNIPNPNTYTNHTAHTFKTAINEIGYDWKNFGTSGWVIEDSLVYFVRRTNGDIWRVIFTGFGGSANGNYIFQKTLVTSTSITDAPEQKIADIAMYPNPVTAGNTVQIAYDLIQPVRIAKLAILDLQGKILSEQVLQNHLGFHAQTLSTSLLSAGVYLIQIQLDNSVHYQKLVIQ